MNLKMDFSNKEQELLKEAGILVENKNYTNEEIQHCERNITEYIMSKSSKNGDINATAYRFNKILNTFINAQKNR